MKKQYLTITSQKNEKNVRNLKKKIITSQILTFLTWHFVSIYLIYFSILYVITSHKKHTPNILLKKGQKRGIYIGCEVIIVTLFSFFRKYAAKKIDQGVFNVLKKQGRALDL